MKKIDIQKKLGRYILNFLSILYFFIISFPHNPTYNSMFIDSGIYAYIGQQINKGKILYKEVWDYKFPAIYYIYAFIFKIFPDSRWTLYFTDIFINIVMLCLIYLILKIFTKDNYFWIISILFTSTYRTYAAFSGGNLTEHFFLFFSFLSFFFLFKKSSKIGDFILGNLFVWLSMLKQPYILIVLIIFLFFKERILEGTKKFFIYGFLTSFLFFVFLFIKGAPESFETITFSFYLTKMNRSIEKINLINFFYDINYRFRVFLFTGPGKQTLLFLPFVLLVKDRIKFLFLSLLISLFLIYFTTFALYTHYMVLLNLSIFIGSIIIVKNYSKKFVLTFLIFCILLNFSLIKRRFVHSYKAFYKFFVLKDRKINVHPLAYTVNKYVKRGETIFISSCLGEVYFITKTESPWRFWGFTQGFDQIPKYRKELQKLIKEKPPDYFYLDIPIKNFEEIFGIRPPEYKLIQIENNFFRFIISKN
ncbi:MAG: hypothetical protein NC816_00545 [Candidatus Omnitrophica bacterium]|nr:hypothetical protein [Candidatus Omnitrophota bacterium]